MKTIKRIAAPKFRVGRFVLNEYEMRQFQNEILERQRPGNVKVKEVLTGHTYLIDDSGEFVPHAPLGYGTSSGLTMRAIKMKRLYNTEIDNSIFSVRVCKVAEYHKFTTVKELYDFVMTFKPFERVKFGAHHSQQVKNSLILKELAEFGLTI